MNAEEEDEVITRSAMNVLARVSLSLPKEQRTLEMDEGIISIISTPFPFPFPFINRVTCELHLFLHWQFLSYSGYGYHQAADHSQHSRCCRGLSPVHPERPRNHF